MIDEPSLGELGRLIQALRGDVRDDMAQINARLDRLVSMDVYTVEKAAMTKDIADLTKDVEQLAAKQTQDIAALQDQRQKDNDRVTQTRRWVVASVVIPLLGLVLPIVLFMAGGK
ncbi:hypothetical protein HZZ00_37610 (plasmid) [Streptomyces sp. NEAU-sy36]|uniref:hypothetical protein n=1 Tax=unclassified Streptomyces TaxID=2593676 RepID=UPI0015D5EBF0|nr:MULTISPECIES: hypothetical protein [unclassified Streptomyces]QLJ06751.1 hypothetical protein HZZ00_37610 [Streptomyces sp. NEAU-sy36]